MAGDEVAFKMNPRWRGAGIPGPLRPDVTRLLHRVGANIVAVAERLVPVSETADDGIPGGSLRSTIRDEVEQTSTGPILIVSAGGIQGAYRFVDYAGYVESGTRRMAAQPYLRPALDQAVRLGRL